MAPVDLDQIMNDTFEMSSSRLADATDEFVTQCSEERKVRRETGDDVRSVRSRKSRGWENMLDFLNADACYADENAQWILPNMQPRGHFGSLFRQVCATLMKRQKLWLVPPGEFLPRPRNCVGFIVSHPAVQNFVLFAILMDVTVTLYKLLLVGSQAFNDQTEAGEELYGDYHYFAFQFSDWFVVIVLAIEVTARVFYLGYHFSHSLMNLLELAIVPFALFEVVTRYGLIQSSSKSPVGGIMPALRTLRPIVRIVNLLLRATRALHHVNSLRHRMKDVEEASRRHYRRNGFDLELCYVTHQLLALGRPTVGFEALYNNPVYEVARFFDTQYRNKFIVVDSTESSRYSLDPFYGRVLRFPVPCYGVPELTQLWALCEAMRSFFDREEGNVCAIHSYYGRGRLGLIAVAWMLFSGEFRDVAPAMIHLERKRTDDAAKATVQGIDCASQQRFLEYFAMCVYDFRGVPAPARPVKLKTLRLLGFDEHDSEKVVVKVFERSRLMLDGAHRNFTTRNLVRGFPGKKGVADINVDAPDTVMLMMHEDEVWERHKNECEAQEFDCVSAGCDPLAGAPVVDTNAPPTPRCLVKREFDADEGVIMWEFDQNVLAGEFRIEIHQILKNGAGGDSGDTQLLFASWLHTSFLELSGKESHSKKEDGSLQVTLRRFDLDKAAGAPPLQTYCTSLEVQMSFELSPAISGPSASTSSASVAAARRKEEPGGQDMFRLKPLADVEMSEVNSAGWLTWCVRRLWPYTEAALVKVLSETIEPQLQESMPGPLKSIHFSKFTLGHTAPELGPIVASECMGKDVALQLDIGLRLSCDANVVMDAGIATVGVNHIGLRGTLSLRFDPILEDFPIVGGMRMFFLNPPDIDLQFVGLAELANYPFLRRTIQNAITASLADSLVLPNHLSINWMPERAITGESNCWLASVLPEAVLHLTVIEAKDLKMVSWLVGSKGADPYAILKLGAFRQKTQAKKHTLDPQWNEVCDLLIYDMRQEFSIEVWNHEAVRGDRAMGLSRSIQVSELVAKSGPQWHLLEAPTGRDDSGRIHMSATLMNLVADKEALVRSIGTGGKRLAALLVGALVKGRLPADSIAGSSLLMRVAGRQDARPCTHRDDSWRQYVDLSDKLARTIEVLVREGFSPAKIAEILKVEEPLVMKAMAARLGFNVELAQHLCVFVEANELMNRGYVEFEVQRKGRCIASARVSLMEVQEAKDLKFRQLIELTMKHKEGHRARADGSNTIATASKVVSDDDSRQRFDLDIELQLMAFGPKGDPDGAKADDETSLGSPGRQLEKGGRSFSKGLHVADRMKRHLPKAPHSLSVAQASLKSALKTAPALKIQTSREPRGLGIPGFSSLRPSSAASCPADDSPLASPDRNETVQGP